MGSKFAESVVHLLFEAYAISLREVLYFYYSVGHCWLHHIGEFAFHTSKVQSAGHSKEYRCRAPHGDQIPGHWIRAKGRENFILVPTPGASGKPGGRATQGENSSALKSK